jgi:hypothetical protein
MRRGVAEFSGTPEQKEAHDRLVALLELPDPSTYEVWGNGLYTVHVTRFETGAVEHLSVHRRDRKPVRDWRDMQRIKNEIAGPEIEGVELYPAQSRVTDTANEYHVWCLRPGDVITLGWSTPPDPEKAAMAESIGATQRPLDEGVAS